MTGFTPDNAKRECIAVKKFVTSVGDGRSPKSACNGVEFGLLPKVCLSEANPFEGVGETGCGAWGGGDEGGFRTLGVEVDGLIPVFFFLLVKGRRNDHSDSN
jgi:hypothetical protein